MDSEDVGHKATIGNIFFYEISAQDYERLLIRKNRPRTLKTTGLRSGRQLIRGSSRKKPVRAYPYNYIPRAKKRGKPKKL